MPKSGCSGMSFRPAFMKPRRCSVLSSLNRAIVSRRAEMTDHVPTTAISSAAGIATATIRRAPNFSVIRIDATMKEAITLRVAVSINPVTKSRKTTPASSRCCRPVPASNSPRTKRASICICSAQVMNCRPNPEARNRRLRPSALIPSASGPERRVSSTCSVTGTGSPAWSASTSTTSPSRRFASTSLISSGLLTLCRPIIQIRSPGRRPPRANWLSGATYAITIPRP